MTHNVPELQEQHHNDTSWSPPEGENVWSLPGFVEQAFPTRDDLTGNAVTYESHHFWVVFDGKHWRYQARPQGELLVQHGAGLRSLRLTKHSARALRDLMLMAKPVSDAFPLKHTAFHLCWDIFALTRDARMLGISQATRDHREAFVEGRLKKRKHRGQSTYNVWMEPKLEREHS